MADKNFSDVVSVRPSTLVDILTPFYKNRNPRVFIGGTPGIGKTSVIYELAKRLDVPVFVFQAMLYDPVELKGLPVFDVQKNEARFIPFKDCPSQKEGILFVDDLPHAPQQTQNAFMRVILEGIAGSWDIGGLYPIAAGNRATDRAGAKDMGTAMANRFVHFDFTVNYEDWRAWALSNGVVPEIVSYLGTPHGSNRLNNFDSTKQVNATPRSWAMASECFKLLRGDNLRIAMNGAIGLEDSTRFLGWLKVYDKLPDLQKIVAGKDIYAEELDVMYATITGLVSIARQMDKKQAIFQRLIDYSCGVPNHLIELGAVLNRDLVSLNKDAFRKCNLDKFMKIYPKLVIETPN